MGNMGISIVVPTLGTKVNLQKLLDSIAKQDIEQEGIDIVIVVNGLNSDGFHAVKKELFSNLKINWVHAEPANVNLARNKGLAQAAHNLVYFLDDDCELINVSTLSFHISVHQKDPDLFAIGGGYNLSINSSYWDELYNSIQMSWLLSGKQGASSEALHLLGGNFTVKKNLLVQNNLKFDEKISYGGSEHQLFVDAAQRNLKIQLCNIDVRHNTKESFKKICYKIFRQGRGKAIIDENINVTIKKNVATSPAFMSSSDGQFGISNLKDSVLKKVLNYIFWYGYYEKKKKPYMLPVKVVKDLLNYLNYLRFKIIDKFK